MPEYRLFPSILPNAEPFVDDSYQEGELERMDYDQLRQIAAKHPNDDVHGRMAKEDLREKLIGLKRVE